MKLWMIGAGPGEPSLISAYALEVMRGAQVVLATERLYEAFQPILENVRLVSLTEMETFLADNPEDVSRVAVLASGDVGFYSISRRLTEKLSGRWEIERVSGVSSLQYLSAKPIGGKLFFCFLADHSDLQTRHLAGVQPLPPKSLKKAVHPRAAGEH